MQPGRGLARRAGPILDLISISARVRVAPASSSQLPSSRLALRVPQMRTDGRAMSRVRSMVHWVCGRAAAVERFGCLGDRGRILAALLHDLYGSLAADAGRIRHGSQNGFAPGGTRNLGRRFHAFVSRIE